MKHIYKKPEINLTEVKEQFMLLAGSPVNENTTRYDEGDPTQSGLPTQVENSGSEGNPYGEAGHDGNTNRAKSGMIWDEW